MNKNKQLAINMTASFIAFAVSIGINFFLSPYIVENVGTEAYGFVQLSNNLVSYFSVLTIALNSMSSRFISVAYFRDDVRAANEYYSSTFFSNVILCVIFTPVLLAGILKADSFMNITPELVMDVKILLAFMAVNFLLGLLGTNLGVSFYVKNKLYLTSIINTAGNLLRAVLYLILFSACTPYVAYIGGVTFFITVFLQSCNIYYKKKLIPELKIKRSFFQWEKVKQLIFSGIWNTVTRMGVLLQEGLDLLITNLMISAADMGVLAIAKTIPNLINNILNAMISTFMPNLTELYATSQFEELKKDIKQSMKIIGMIINIPIALLIGFGDTLFSLWFPTQDARLLQILSVLTVLPWAVMGPATIIHNIFTVVNKIKVNAVLVCITGVLSVAIVYILLSTTSLGLFAVAGVSSILSVIRNLAYTVPFGAIYIHCPWYTYFPEIGKSVLAILFISAVSYVLKGFIGTPSWIMLILFGAAAGIIGLLFNYFIVLNREDRSVIIAKLRNIKK